LHRDRAAGCSVTARSPTIRVATRADLPAIAAVFVAAWRAGYRGVVPDDVIESYDLATATNELAPGFEAADRTTIAALAVEAAAAAHAVGTADAAAPTVEDAAVEAGAVDAVAARPPLGPVVGFARFGADRDAPAGPGGYLASLYVHPAAGGRGVGRALLRTALDSMSGMDVTLWVFAGNATARRLYESAGFRLDGAELTDPRWRTPQVRYRRPADARAYATGS
jgi:ribosomal protein S18 acetylase RimI-like enzyme